MSDSKQVRGGEVVGGANSPRPGRKLELEQKLFANTDQTVPIRILRGQDRIAGTHIFPVFGFRTEEQDTEGGK